MPGKLPGLPKARSATKPLVRSQLKTQNANTPGDPDSNVPAAKARLVRKLWERRVKRWGRWPQLRNAKHNRAGRAGECAAAPDFRELGTKTSNDSADFTVGSDQVAPDSFGSLIIRKITACRWKFLNENDMCHETLLILVRNHHVSRNHMNPCTKTPSATKPYENRVVRDN